MYFQKILITIFYSLNKKMIEIEIKYFFYSLKRKEFHEMMSNKIVWIKTKYVTVIMGISIVDILFYKLKKQKREI